MRQPGRKEGLKHIAPLFELWTKAKQEGIIKEMSPYLLYSFTIYPLAFLMNMENRKLSPLDDKVLEHAF